MPLKINSNLILILIVLVIGGVFIWQRGSRDDFQLPSGGETKTEQIIIDNESKEIMITDGVKHSVPLGEIVGGGPPKDGIPSIDNPKFVLASQADFIICLSAI